MLVKVYLDGEMGGVFGKTWELNINTPREALQLIQANTGRLFNWIRNNLKKYEYYKVLCVFKNGKKEYLNNDTFLTAHEIKEIRFTPLIAGSGGKKGGWLQTIAGAVLVVAGAYFGNPGLIQAGAGLMMGGISALMTRKQKTNQANTNTSHYFQGVDRTQNQGNPVPLIYGRCKVVGIPISVKMTVDEESMPTNGSQKSLKSKNTSGG